MRPGAQNNNDPAIIEALMNQIKSERPRVLMRTDEPTNNRLAARLSAWARREGYTPFSGPYVIAWIRTDP